ncbi:hypothetical protein ACIBHX_25860 [Nonomuraea sp. NPDC050536]|uniref:hypothetical protein n=1 Tax=Nonomuraea sp. NPDC050536 TaxID=3364366 RepID=UPI0037CC9442
MSDPRSRISARPPGTLGRGTARQVAAVAGRTRRGVTVGPLITVAVVAAHTALTANWWALAVLVGGAALLPPGDLLLRKLTVARMRVGTGEFAVRLQRQEGIHQRQVSYTAVLAVHPDRLAFGRFGSEIRLDEIRDIVIERPHLFRPRPAVYVGLTDGVVIGFSVLDGAARLATALRTLGIPVEEI